MKDLKKISGSTPELSRLQSNLENWAASMLKGGPTDGRLITDIELLTGTTNLVEHKLGRNPAGYFVMLKGNSVVWNSQDSNIFKTKSLALECSANVTIDLWVF